ncbi:MAG: amino acid ABC transporter substrate-binding protein [Alphaproteobacteria bacterium]|nr:amino acid ABC transporter substrate-binding protein [Alphaproteobacteria bacterium]
MRTPRAWIAAAAAVATVTLSGIGVTNAATLEDVRAAGTLKCGINTGLPGFAYTDDRGTWTGFDVAYCQALAAAVLGDPTKVRYVNVSAANRFTALASGEIDVLSRNTTWTFQRDNELGFTFAGVSYYDGQGFLIRRSLRVASAKELNGASVCIQRGTTTELNLADYFRANNLRYEPVPIADNEEARVAYVAGRCDVYTADASALAATKSALQNPNDHMILPEVISKEPLGPLVRQGDERWSDIARWTLNVLLAAEEYGVTQANVRDMARAATPNPEVNRMLGSEGSLGAMLGLAPNWAVNVIAAVGNYGEMFERYLGARTPLGLPRGLNALYKNGGVLYPLPMR